MSPANLFGLILFALFVFAAIGVGNFFFAKIIGIDVASLPPLYKSLTHLVGAGIVFIVIKKVFVR